VVKLCSLLVVFQDMLPLREFVSNVLLEPHHVLMLLLLVNVLMDTTKKPSQELKSVLLVPLEP